MCVRASKDEMGSDSSVNLAYGGEQRVGFYMFKLKTRLDLRHVCFVWPLLPIKCNI